MARSFQTAGTSALKAHFAGDCVKPDANVVAFHSRGLDTPNSKPAFLAGLVNASVAYEAFDLSRQMPQNRTGKIKCFLAAALPIAALFLSVLASANF